MDSDQIIVGDPKMRVSSDNSFSAAPSNGGFSVSMKWFLRFSGADSAEIPQRTMKLELNGIIS